MEELFAILHWKGEKRRMMCTHWNYFKYHLRISATQSCSNANDKHIYRDHSIMESRTKMHDECRQIPPSNSWKTARRNAWRVLELIHRPVAYYKKNNHNFLLGRGTTVEELTYLWFCVFTYSVRIMVVVCVSDCTCCCGRWLRSKAAEKRREDIPISWFLGDWGWNWNVEQTQWIVDSHRSQVKSISNVERGKSTTNYFDSCLKIDHKLTSGNSTQLLLASLVEIISK